MEHYRITYRFRGPVEGPPRRFRRHAGGPSGLVWWMITDTRRPPGDWRALGRAKPGGSMTPESVYRTTRHYIEKGV